MLLQVGGGDEVWWLTQVPLKPPSVSVDAMTLWQGTTGAKGFLRMPCEEAGGLSMQPVGGSCLATTLGLRGVVRCLCVTVALQHYADSACWVGVDTLLSTCVATHLSNCTCGAVERCCKVAVCGHLALRDELAQLHPRTK